MKEIIKHLSRAIRILNEEYPWEDGHPSFAINNRSYDIIKDSKLSYETDIYIGTLNENSLDMWNDFKMVTKELEPLLKTLSKENNFFYTREFEHISPIITIFDANTSTYERYYIKNERTFYDNRFYDSFIEKNELIKNVTNRTSDDPIFQTLVNFYNFKPKN